MADIASLKTKQAHASERIVKALGITLPHRRNGIPNAVEFHLAETLDAIADALEVKEPEAK